MKLKTCKLEIVFLLVVALLLSFGTSLERQQQEIANSMIRLHVKANSNSRADQALKLKVRDAVLEYAEIKLMNCKDRNDAIFILHDNLDVFERVANEVLMKSGVKDTAQVSFNRELFSTRYYDTFALPGGYYDALRVTIGKGEGKNWWCVVYPKICTASVSDAAVSVMGTDGETVIFPNETGEYSFRFKTLELFENIMGWIRSRDDGIPTSR